MKALLIKPEKHIATEVEIDSFYDILSTLEISVFDVAYRQIGVDESRIYCFYVDDNGLLKENPIVSAWGATDNSTLVGNILITKPGSDGEDESLSQSDIDYIISNTHNIIDIQTGQNVTAVFPIFYPNNKFYQ